MAEVEYEDQGYGVYLPFSTLAEIASQNKNIDSGEKAIHNFIQKLARENAESYTPSDALGENPSSRVSPTLRKFMAPSIYSEKYIKKISDTKVGQQAAQVEIGGAVNHLTQAILKHVYKFKTKRKPKVDKSNPKELTDFEYVASGPGNDFTKEQREIYNKQIDANRHIRIMLESYIFHSILPLLADTKSSIYQAMVEMGYKEMKASDLRKQSYYKEVVYMMSKMFLILFGRTKFTDFIKTLRWSPKSATPKIRVIQSGHKSSSRSEES